MLFSCLTCLPVAMLLVLNCVGTYVEFTIIMKTNQEIVDIFGQSCG